MISDQKLIRVDKSWTLLLDRDGVINVRLLDDYVKSVEEFTFIQGVPESLGLFSKIFGRILVFTNQQGIGKGLMTENDLTKIHHKMLKTINNQGGEIDAIYFCPHLKEEHCDCRKPNILSLQKAKNDFPEIDFSKSIMVGDTKNDIIFGKKVGAITVMIDNKENIEANYTIDSLPKLLDLVKYNL